jgi:hypothetical protein
MEHRSLNLVTTDELPDSLMEIETDNLAEDAASHEPAQGKLEDSQEHQH